MFCWLGGWSDLEFWAAMWANLQLSPNLHWPVAWYSRHGRPLPRGGFRSWFLFGEEFVSFKCFLSRGRSQNADAEEVHMKQVFEHLDAAGEDQAK